ncbi:MAG TPA: DNA polymerase I [Dehalococcoidia bacterium]|nr:DNA polymerase I [Dehalococcoidia bacterium]
MTTPRLVLIDGHSLIHRSFHAMKQLKEPLRVAATGELIGAPFGFANTFLAMFGELKPTHVIVALDKAGPTFRHEITETYKATRVAMPEEERDEFRRQLNRCRQVIETFGMPIYELEGFEADDLLGTLSRQAAEHGIDTFLVSLDSDIAQLVQPGVHLWMYRPYQRDSVIYLTEEDVQTRYGVLPHQMPDLKALKGDVSDNIPGVPGVGEKTAIKLVRQFSSVEALYERIDEVEPPKLREALQAAAQQVRQSKQLASIVTDAPVPLDLDAADFAAHYDRARVLDLFRELEFRSLVPRLPEGGAAAPAAPAPAAGAIEERYAVVRAPEELDALARRIAAQRWFVLDTETTNTDAMRADLVGLALGLGAGEAFYVPVGHASNGQLQLDDALQRLGPLMEDPEVPITGHNLKFDLVVLGRHGVRPRCLAFDTMIAAYLLGEGGGGALSLPWLVSRRLGIEMEEVSQLLGGGRKSAQLTMDAVDVESAGRYACAGVDMTARLRDALDPELDQKGMRRLFQEIEMPLVSVLARMEMNGVAIDTGALREMAETLTLDVRRLEENIYASVGHEFNIGSPQQLSHILFEELHLPKTRRLKTGAYSTDAQALENLRGLHDIIDLIYEYRELTKLKSTYLDTLPFLVHPETRRLHTDFNQTGAATGRLSSSNPNLQNIPVRTELGAQIRRAFIARDVGPHPRLLSADYSQIELRIMAHITRDAGLLEAFQRDEDIHAATASQVFGVPLDQVTPLMRRRAKVFNFGVLYGLSEYGLSTREKIPREEAAVFIRTYFEKYPGIKRYVEETVQKVRELGYAETLFGRRRYLPEIISPNFNVRNAAERAAINMPVQGTAADIIKIAMNRLDAEMERRRLRSLMILQIHDELMFECPEDELETMRALVLDIMPKSMDLQGMEMAVPLKIDTKVGRNWGEMEYGEATGIEEMVG